MKVFRSIDELPRVENTAVTVGTFDGIHRGHKKILEALTDAARMNRGRSLLLTFSPHPSQVVSRERVKLLTTLEEKVTILKEWGLDTLMVIQFTEKIARMEPDVFIRDWLVEKAGATAVVAGFNHAFGYRRRGNDDLLEELARIYGFTVHIVPPVYHNETRISSTEIRHLLNNGDVELASYMLGRNYTLSGIVMKGKMIGTKLGFPTANLQVNDSGKLIPADGVYAVIARLDGTTYRAMANIGYQPTIPGGGFGLEVHLHDFKGDLYGQKLSIEFINRIREEKKFASREALVKQLICDSRVSQDILADRI